MTCVSHVPQPMDSFAHGMYSQPVASSSMGHGFLSGPIHTSSPSVLSSRGMLRVLSYHPLQGAPGTLISVTLAFKLQTRDTIHLRLVLGRAALTTIVRWLPTHESEESLWELCAHVPADAYPAGAGSTTVPIAAQALNGRDEVLDSVTFGTFTCVHFAPSGGAESHGDVFGVSPLVHTAVEPAPHASRKPSPPKKPSFTRTRRFGSSESDTEAPCATLKLETPLESMCKDWGADELRASRRLVRFTRMRDGGTLRVSCAPLHAAQYADGETAISCIYRAETDSCCVTSVDIIFLLERLVGHEFDIDEKNRIRRNLEGFKPKTVSKNRADSADFFLQIMNFPPPKPRNIEKDLKVFDWSVLPLALAKIISRYTLPDADADLDTSANTSTSLMTYSLAYPDSTAHTPRPSTPYVPTLDAQDHSIPSLVDSDSSGYYDSSLIYSPVPAGSAPSCIDPSDLSYSIVTENPFLSSAHLGLYQPFTPCKLLDDAYALNGANADIAAFGSVDFETLRAHRLSSGAYTQSFL